MNALPAYQPTLYDELCALPEGVTGEILKGQLHTMTRPIGRHGLAEGALNVHIGGPFGIVNERTLEAYELRLGLWVLIATLADDVAVRVPPFDAVEFPLGDLWA